MGFLASDSLIDHEGRRRLQSQYFLRRHYRVVIVVEQLETAVFLMCVSSQDAGIDCSEVAPRAGLALMQRARSAKLQLS